MPGIQKAHLWSEELPLLVEEPACALNLWLLAVLLQVADDGETRAISASSAKRLRDPRADAAAESERRTGTR